MICRTDNFDNVLAPSDETTTASLSLVAALFISSSLKDDPIVSSFWSKLKLVSGINATSSSADTSSDEEKCKEEFDTKKEDELGKTEDREESKKQMKGEEIFGREWGRKAGKEVKEENGMETGKKWR